MGHHIQAFVGSKEALDVIWSKYGQSKVVPLKHGYYLLPLTEEFYDTIDEVNEQNAYPSSNEFLFLTTKISKLLLDYSDATGLVYLETDYFGGAGGQGAITAKEGKIVYGPSRAKRSINKALRKIGVRRILADEFNRIGLGAFRCNEDWLQKAVMSDEEFCDALDLRESLERAVCILIRNESAKCFRLTPNKVLVDSKTLPLNNRAWTPFIASDVALGLEDKLSELFGCPIDLRAVCEKMQFELPFSKRWFGKKNEAKTFGQWCSKLTKMITDYITKTVDEELIEQWSRRQ